MRCATKQWYGDNVGSFISRAARCYVQRVKLTDKQHEIATLKNKIIIVFEVEQQQIAAITQSTIVTTTSTTAMTKAAAQA